MGTVKHVLVSGLVLGALAVSGAAAVPGSGSNDKIAGDYIESRSASVYAGPCHYSNEAVTAGRTATLAWHFNSGAYHGVSLKGLNAVAVLSADGNLADDPAARHAVLYLDARATPAQTAALRSLFTEKYSAELGRVEAVKAAAVQVSHDDLDYHVRVDKVAQLEVNRYLCQHCTEQPFQVWYQPFVPASDVIVGRTTRTAYHDNVLGISWDDRQEADSAFVGSFAL